MPGLTGVQVELRRQRRTTALLALFASSGACVLASGLQMGLTNLEWILHVLPILISWTALGVVFRHTGVLLEPGSSPRWRWLFWPFLFLLVLVLLLLAWTAVPFVVVTVRNAPPFSGGSSLTARGVKSALRADLLWSDPWRLALLSAAQACGVALTSWFRARAEREG